MVFALSGCATDIPGDGAMVNTNPVSNTVISQLTQRENKLLTLHMENKPSTSLKKEVKSYATEKKLNKKLAKQDAVKDTFEMLAKVSKADQYVAPEPEEPEIIETGRMITVGEYAGIKGFRNVYENLELEFQDEDEARNILELARYANVHTQKPLTDSELKFIYFYPDVAAKIMTVEPYYMPQGALKERMERLEEIQAHRIV